MVEFWLQAGPERWFAKDAAFDREFRERFLGQHEAAARGELVSWLATPEGALGLVLLLDQFPRNAFRDSPRMYGTDEAATVAARAALAARHDQALPEELRVFLYLPFSHSEHLADQQRAVDLCRALGGEPFSQAEEHRDIIWRFGRFPHRNVVLGRPSTAEEAQYLADGGFLG